MEATRPYVQWDPLRTLRKVSRVRYTGGMSADAFNLSTSEPMDLVDLDRYPLTDLDGEAGQAGGELTRPACRRRYLPAAVLPPTRCGDRAGRRGRGLGATGLSRTDRGFALLSVSYTHLTLPTIYPV